MTFYEIAPHRPAPTGGLFARIGAGFGGVVRSMQYARMVQALSELSDDNLRSIGLARADIPRRAREAVYGPDA